MKNKILFLSFFFSIFSFVLFIFSSSSNSYQKVNDIIPPQEAKLSAAKRNSCGYDFSSGYADLVEKIIPSVVNISSTSIQEKVVPTIQDLFGFGMMFDEFGGFSRKGRKVKKKSTSLGSGFFIDDKGNIATNYHVIKDATEIKITTHDRKEYKAKIVSFDPKSDLAVIQSEAKSSKNYAKFGLSSESRIGDFVLAIGNPFGLGGTVTSGIISAKSRSLTKTPYDDYLQTDTPINRGNSGGPMFNTCGEVIGINTAIFSTSGGNIGIGFAIASDTAGSILNKLRNKEQITRAWLGVEIQVVTDEIASAVGLKDKSGVYVNNVSKGSPAEKSGIKSGDLILKVNDKEIKDPKALSSIVVSSKVGSKIDLQILRDGKKIILNSTLEEVKNQMENDVSEEKVDSDKTFGLVLETLTKEKRREMKIPDDINGVIIVDVKNEILEEFGEIQEDDLLTAINGVQVASVADVKKIASKIKSSGKNHIILKVYRNGVNISIGVPIK